MQRSHLSDNRQIGLAGWVMGEADDKALVDSLVSDVCEAVAGAA
jgi:hypothetical protein